MSKLLTVGMATHTDFDGVYLTLTVLREFHGDWFDVLVIDTAPKSCRRTKGISLACGGRYLHRPDLVGTSISRDSVFRVATSDWVVCCDSHVPFCRGSLDALKHYIEMNPNRSDFIQGPLLLDDGKSLSTHWDQPAPPGLWGRWALDKRVTEGQPFEIPMMGLGAWAMRRAAWPGFNPLFRGFGGEEGYIHERVRRFAGKSICLPGFRWRHRFRDEEVAAPYSPKLEDHVYNLLIGHRELGIEAPAQIFQDFGKRVPQATWNKLLEETAAFQPFDELRPFPKPLRILGVWYSNNSAPESLLKMSLQSIKAGMQQTRHQVQIVTSPWRHIEGNPFQEMLSDRTDLAGHGRIISQIRQCLEAAAEFDAVAFLEHDVLYPPGKFDQLGDLFQMHPKVNAVSNLDYIGLNASGWLAVKERHEPMHQLAMRKDYALANLQRAWADCERNGQALLEPQDDRGSWERTAVRGLAPAVHVNHTAGRFTSHGEVCFAANGKPAHDFWGEAAKYWPASAPQKIVLDSLDHWYQSMKGMQSDFQQHMDTLKALADGCQVVVEISTWNKPALLSLAASSAKQVVSITEGAKPEWGPLNTFRPNSFVGLPVANRLTADVPNCDLLFVDTLHQAGELKAILQRNSERVSRSIVLHCTETFGQHGDDGGPGLVEGLNDFLGTHPEWGVAKVHRGNHGLTVLQRGAPGRVVKPLNLNEGPGTELKSLIGELGINPNEGCDCNAKAKQMNIWGTAECKHRRDEILGWLRAGAPKWGWRERIMAMTNVATSKLALRMDIVDPLAWLVDESLRRARTKENASHPSRVA